MLYSKFPVQATLCKSVLLPARLALTRLAFIHSSIHPSIPPSTYLPVLASDPIHTYIHPSSITSLAIRLLIALGRHQLLCSTYLPKAF
jgi:hypothetical protein